MPTATTRSSDLQPRLKQVSGAKARRQERHPGHRYGRVRREGDEDIVRQARSDDEAESESVRSDEGDSMSQSSAASLPDSHQRSSSPSFLRPDLSNGNTSSLSDPSDPLPSTSNSISQVLQPSRLDWSDIAQESEEGVQVIHYDNLGDLTKEDTGNEEEEEAAKATSRDPRTTKRPGGMSARQVYLKRLENDPAYIPRVGEFWGHDERLLDKDLRSLSGWWRGKWTARGGFSGRGRGSFGPSGHHRSFTVDAHSGEHQSDPVDQTWKHDGYEELNKGDESSSSKAKNREEVFRGRGRGRGLAVRGLGPVTRPARSQSSASQAQNNHIPIRPYGHNRSYSLWGRYEHAWTKHAVTFLFQDVLNKPKNGEDVGVRVKLPGQQRYNVVRILKPDPSIEASISDRPPQPARSIVVKLPTRSTAAPKAEGVSQLAPSLPLPELQEVKPKSHDADVAPLPSGATKASNPRPTEVISDQIDVVAPQAEETLQPRSPPGIQLITNLPATTPSPAYSSPSYGPGYQYPMPRPAYPGMQMAETPMWFDPRMPYGYPTPPPMPGHVYTPPPLPAHHIHHHHAHSLSHPHNFPPGPPMATSYYHPSVMPIDYSQVAPLPDYTRPQQERRASRSYAYSADGVMVDLQTGAPIFAPPKITAKVAIRKPENLQTSDQRQTKQAPSGDAPVGNSEPAVVSTPAPQYVPPSEEAAMPYLHGVTPGSAGPAVWSGFPPAQGGYYYHHGYPTHGQGPEYPFGQPPHAAHPMQAFPPHYYGEQQEYQPPVYY